MRLHTTLSGHEVRYDEPSSELETFLRRVQQAVEDPKVTEAALLALIYSGENPLLDRSVPEHPRVTKEVLEHPVYDVLQDLLFRKHVKEAGVDLEKVAERYSMPVPEAAKRLGVQASSIHRAIQSKRLASWIKNGQHFVEPAAVDALDVGRRGPVAAHVAPLEYRVGQERDAMMRIRLPGEPEPASKRAPVDGKTDRWRKVGVLHGHSGKLKFFVLEPDGEANEIALGSLFVRGRFRITEKVSKGSDAQKAWDAFRPL